VNYLLDTNIICEPTRPRPDRAVLVWLAETDEDCLYVSAATLAEIQRGVSRLPRGNRRAGIQQWLDCDVLERFGDRILPVDHAVALRWGQIMAEAESSGRSMNPLDGFIAATAMARGLTLVTRNVGDFRDSVPQIVNPWEG
jgi:predicted nucleic acid-binding protein